MEDATPSSPEADAAHEMTIKAAEGAGLPQDWTAALDHLQRSAQLGSRLAQAELTWLAGQWPQAHDILAGKAAPDSRWLRFRSSIDLETWLEPPRPSNISDRPALQLSRTSPCRKCATG